MAQPRPNFIFILADDLGWADLGCYGSRHIATPHLDRLAAAGLRFTDGYANSALCSPSRFALITGRYQYRLRGAAEEPLLPSAVGSQELGLPPSHPTLPSLLAGAGYHTALIGKWHLGYPPHFGPAKSGYREFFGLHGGGIDYFSHVDPAGRRDMYEGEATWHGEGYITDVLSDRAVDFVHRQRDAAAPFLLSLHYTAPHWPWETRADEAESQRIGKAIAHFDGGSLDIYREMVQHMDAGIGRLMAALSETGQADNTLVVFTSDNGGERFSDAWPFRGKKMDLLEGGIRVPLLAHWPAVIAPGSVSSQVAVTMDWLPTMLAAAGVAPDPAYAPDGINLLPVLAAPSQPMERTMFWRMGYRDQQALRRGRWKYLRLDGHEFLFDLVADPHERANHAQREPTLLAEMRALHQHWNSLLPEIPPDANISAHMTPDLLAMPTC